MPQLIKKRSGIEGFGVYAGEKIPKGTRIIEYRGRKLTKAQGNRSNSKFLFILNRRTDVLGQNLAKFINHTCEPNCETIIEGTEIWIYAIRDIRKGEELSYNYSYAWDEDPAFCLCSSPSCPGYMLDKEAWPKLIKAKRSGLLPKPENGS